MLELIMTIISLWWFYHTEYFVLWSKVKIGGEQISMSVTALIVVIYIIIIIFEAVKWHYSSRNRW